MDALLLKILKHREHYETLMPQVDLDILHPTTSYVLQTFGAWFRDTKDTVIDMEDFKAYFFNFLKPNDTTEKKMYYNSLFNNCKPDVDKYQTALITQNLISHTFATQVGNIITKYNEDAEIDVMQEIGIKHSLATAQLDKNEEEVHRDLNEIEEILDRDLYQTGVKFSLAILRDNLRPLQSGDFIITAGRPDSGKTSFLSSQLLSFLDTIEGERPVLWFNNEGEGNRIIKRIYQSVLQARTKDLLQYRNDGSLNKRFNLLVQNPERIKIIDCHGWNTGDIEKTVKRYQPGLIIVDMIDNILFPNIRDGARTDQVLEEQYQWFRILGVRYGFPVVATSQVSAEAEQQTHTQMWPALSMLKDSKTGKQGAADTVIMIGRSLHPDIPINCRFISTPKNKLAIEQSYIKSEVTFDAQRATYE